MADYTNYNSSAGQSRYGADYQPGGKNSATGEALANTNVNAPTIDPRLSNLQKTQQTQADNYRTTGKQQVKDAYAGYADTSNRQLAQNINTVNTNYNQRGLLYSGLNKGTQSDVAGSAASDLAAKRSALNQQYQTNQDTLDQAPINTGIAMAGMGTNQSSAIGNNNILSQQQALYQQQQQQAGLSSLGQGLGAIGGYAAGALTSPSSALGTSTNYMSGYNYANPTQSVMPGIGYSYGG